MKQATKLNQVMLLIKSLSKAEKRYIRLYTNLQNGDKHYMVLYDPGMRRLLRRTNI